MKVSEKYLMALKIINRWTTVSDWAIEVGTQYPDILEKADLEAKNQKNDTTGLREIAARISSNISRGAYYRKIEIDDSERPRKVRYLSDSEGNEITNKELEEDLAPLTRNQIIKKDESELSTKDRYRLAEFETIIAQLRSFFNLDFEFEHAKALLNPTDPGTHHPDNIQLLLKNHNRIKSNNNWERFTLDEQIEYIQAAVKIQNIVSKKLNVDLEVEVIDQIIERLKSIY